MSQPDPRPPARVRDPDLLRRLHLEWRECAICGFCDGRLSLHHVLKHPRNDVRANLVMLCGDGVSGCHGMYELGDLTMRALLAKHIFDERPDIADYLIDQLGAAGADDWLSVRLQGVRKR